MATIKKAQKGIVVDKYMPTANEISAVRAREAKAFAKIRERDAKYNAKYNPKKAIKKAQYGESVYKDAKGYNVVTKTNTKDGPRYYKTTGPVESAARNRNLFNIKNNPADSVRAKDIDPIDLKKLAGMKNGGKAKDGKWIQKAVNPKHKGYCTPMTKATCTPKRKALAKTFKAMGRARKGK